MFPNNLGLIDANGLIAALNQMGGIPDFNQPTSLQAFQKALTSTSGYTGYDLEPTVRRLLPSYTVLRQRVAVDSGPVGPSAGTAAVYKAQLGFNGFNFGASMGTAFGANGNDGNPSATQIAADYKSQVIHGSVQLEVIDFARQFTDPLQDQSLFNLTALMRLEELLLLGGNETAIATPVPAGAQGVTGGSNFHTGTWRVRVTALTLKGCLSNATAAAAITGAGVYPGETVAGYVDITVSSSAKSTLTVHWPEIPGALGYKVYVSTAYSDTTDTYLSDPATEMLASDGVKSLEIQFPGQKYVTVNSVTIINPPAGSQTYPTSDGSADANEFEGYWAWSTKSTMYGTSLASVGTKVVTDMAGAALTAETSGVVQINDALQSLALNYHTAPTAMVGSVATIRGITNLITSNNNTNMMLVGNQGGNLQQQNKVIGGIMIGGYTNQFAQHYGMSPMIDIIAHPYMPNGALMLLSETLPPDTYRNANDSRCFALDVLRPYNYFPLASTDRNINFDIWFLETLKCIYPTAQSAIVGFHVN